MNYYALILAAALLGCFLLTSLGDWLNLRQPRRQVPAPLADCLDAAWLQRASAYLQANTRFALWESAFHLAVLFAVWFSGGLNALDLWVRQFGLNPVLTGVLYIGGLAALHTLLSMPFSIYDTFVIEARFGFNRTDWRTFALDHLKGLGLMLLLGVPLLAAILYFFDRAGAHAWLYAWGAMTGFSLFTQFLAPVLILPLFNRFTPLADGELRDTVLALARRANFPLTGVFTMDGSKRSTKANAFFTGFGRFKRIALYDTLIKEHSVPELEGILAHEIGHYKLRHIRNQMVLGLVHSAVIFYLLSLFLTHPGLFAAFQMQHASTYAGLVFFGILYTPVERILELGLNYLSRRQEFAADRFAASLTGTAAPLASALKKLSTSSLSDATPHPFYVWLHYSHPPLLQRLEALNCHNAGNADSQR